jgi:hypothetical protein
MVSSVYITSRELVQQLNINSQELLAIEEFFDADSLDEWELTEGKDYKIVNRTTGLREYSLSGAYTIARYVEVNKRQKIWFVIKEWFTQTQAKIRKSFLKKKILQNSSSLVKRSGYFFISRSDVIAIFGTRSDYLSKMAEEVRRSRYPLEEGKDYANFADEGGIYFSPSGIVKLSQAFAACHSKKNRREECADIGSIIESQIKDISEQILAREKSIYAAKEKAKKRDKKTCRVSQVKSDRINKIPLAAHHLYSQNEYPHLADVENNLITLAGDVHTQFHQEFMGGTVKACTIDDFIQFVHHYYPDNSQVINWLEGQKIALGNQQPVNARKPHVLYLPASRVA